MVCNYKMSHYREKGLIDFFLDSDSLYVDDNILFISGEDKDITKYLLSSDLKILENWFFANHMILNPGIT